MVPLSHSWHGVSSPYLDLNPRDRSSENELMELRSSNSHDANVPHNPTTWIAEEKRPSELQGGCRCNATQAQDCRDGATPQAGSPAQGPTVLRNDSSPPRQVPSPSSPLSPPSRHPSASPYPIYDSILLIIDNLTIMAHYIPKCAI